MIPSDPIRSQWGWALLGARHASGINAVLITVTMLGVGGLAREVGFPLGATVLSTLLIWAGPAQIILFGSLSAGVALPAIALAVFVSSMRFLPMTVSLLPYARSGDDSPWKLVLAAHLCSMSTWVEGLRRLPHLPVEARMPYHLGFGSTVLLVAAIATAAGYHIYGALPPLLAAGLLFMSPVYFAYAIAGSAFTRSDWTTIFMGVALSPPAFLWLPSGIDLLAIGLAGGSLAYLARRPSPRAGEGRP
jgi:predicted branched-subunit amino acid permease